MTTKITADELFGALESLQPDPEQRTNAWYIGRRETVFQQVLDRAAASPANAPPARKPRRRAIAAGGLAIALVGAGTAWAFSNYTAWYTGGALDGLTCMTTWHDPFTGDQRPDQYGGSELSTDPIADCDRYAELSGKARIVDPVAVRYQEAVVVGPRAGMPADAVPLDDWSPSVTPSDTASPTPAESPKVVLDPTRDAAKEMELENSLDDRVAGGNRRCWDAESGEQFARDELARLGLADWQTMVREQEPRAGNCAFLFVQEPGLVEVRTHGQDDPATTASTSLANTLRREITEKCLSLSAAEQAVASVLDEGEHHWPTSAQVDPEAACARVDLVYGGSQQVFLYGPKTAR